MSTRAGGLTCPQCGARYGDPSDDCAARFAQLLALDHSRTEPWGSRHGVAFSVYTLQHPAGIADADLERCWQMLHRVYVKLDDPMDVARGMRRAGKGPTGWDAPALPASARTPHRYSVTISDLGAFEAEGYPAALDAWCRSTLAGLHQ